MKPAPGTKVFLIAEWRDLVMISWAVDPALLHAHVPRGTTLDSHGGRTFVSLVGFRFRNTRVLGIPVPFHRHFDEINLRFYVRREVAGELRRGVVFLREIVPRAAIALVARAMYNEPYVTAPTQSEASLGELRATATYRWRRGSEWCSINAESSGTPTVPAADSHASFIAEHYWGYTRQRDGGTIEYRVTHEPWRVWAGAQPHVSANVAGFYGGALGDVTRTAPHSALIAEGSSVTVFRPNRI